MRIVGLYVKVAAQQPKCCAFDFDLARRTDAEAAQDRHGRAPALEGVKEQEASDEKRESQKLAIDHEAKRQSEKCDGGRIGFENAFNVPFPVRLSETLGDSGATMNGGIVDVTNSLVLYAAVDAEVCTVFDAGGRRW